MNALLLHVPKGFADTDWRHNYVSIMPMGLFAVANYANHRGHQAKVMNCARHGSTDAALRLALERIDAGGAEVVGLPLHWHFSGHDVLAAVRLLKARRPALRCVVGGLTASVFAAELLAACPELDAVIQGDGELPFAAYLEALAAGRPLAEVPNLHWRDGATRRDNGLGYVAGAAEVDALDFDPGTCMLDLDEYVTGRGMFDAIAGRYDALVGQPLAERCFFVNVGRGCSFNCVYCSGSRVAFARYFGRAAPLVRSVDAVLRSVAAAYGRGFRTFHICFDPAFPGKRGYFPALFRRVHDQVAADLTLMFEAYGLPSVELLDALASNFARGVVVLSPCFFDAAAMRRYKGYAFTDEQLRATLAEIRRRPGLEAFVYYAITPLESFSADSIADYVARMNALRAEFGCRVSAMPIQAEPGCPWVAFPDLFPVEPYRLEFADFLAEWRAPLDHWSERLCYGLTDIDAVVARINATTTNDLLE